MRERKRALGWSTRAPLTQELRREDAALDLDSARVQRIFAGIAKAALVAIQIAPDVQHLIAEHLTPVDETLVGSDDEGTKKEAQTLA